jgi:MOSC domain-containing protein YiiM
MNLKGTVIAVSKSKTHTLIKENKSQIILVKGLGVEGDAHFGEKVKHRSRVKKFPNNPNLRQVHLMHSELFNELKQDGFNISAGQMGENITTSDIDILHLPVNTILHLGNDAKVQLTGFRNPCAQLDGLQKGLMKAVLTTEEDGNLFRKSGVFGIILKGGIIFENDKIVVELPQKPYQKLPKG